MKLSTLDKINAGFAIAFLMVVLIGVVSYESINTLIRNAATVEDTHRVLTGIERAVADVTEAEAAGSGFVITGDERYLTPYQDAAKRVTSNLRELRDRTLADAEQQARLAQLGQLAAHRLAQLGVLIATRRTAGVDSAAAIIRGGEGKVTMDSLRTVAADFDRRERTLLGVRSFDSADSAWYAKYVINIGSVFAFLLVLGAVLVIRRDITERKRAEQALRDSQAMLGQFLESMPVGAYVVDVAGRPRFANSMARRLLGEDIAPREDDEAVPPTPALERSDGEPYPAEQLPLVKALAGQRATVDDARVRHDHDAIPLEVSAAPIFDAGGRVSHAVAVLADITERRRHEEALRGAKEAAEEANQAKSDFLARMSHELRTPLNSVIGFANILLKNKAGNLRDQDLTYLERVQQNGKHLLTLINDILDLSKIEARRIDLERTTFAIGALVTETTTELEGQVGESLQLVTDVPDQPLSLEADRNRLKQVLINLVGNAIKFTEQGRVTVAVDTAGDPPRPVRIRVSDTGIGIPPERLDAIFEAFEQAESSTSRKYGGTGLGLPISRKLCEIMGFRLTVESAPGQGTTFAIDLEPGTAAVETREQPPAAPAPATRPGHSARPSGERRVLVVDDEADSRILLTHYLEELGCGVTTTHSGATALRLARELTPDLITLDLMMPDMNGWEVLARLKADPQLADIPVVIVSIVANEHRASLLGAVDILEKPIVRTDLVQVLQRNLDSASPAPRVLVIDDSADSRLLLTNYLEKYCSELRSAENGADALAMLASFTPDLIVLDLMMPVMDGPAFLEQIRKNPAYTHIPVVVVTAKDLSADEQERLRRQTVAILEKGSTLEAEVAGLLRAVLAEPPQPG